MIDIGANIK